MMGGRKFFLAVVAILSILFMSLPAYAGTYSGTISGAQDNPYGIGMGGATTLVTLDYDVDSDPKTFSMLFDTGPVSDPLYYAYFDETDVFGSLTMTDEPGGQLTNLEFTTDLHDASAGPLGMLTIEEGDPMFPSALGSIGYDLEGSGWGISGTLTYTAIPIPGAIWLLGSGMIGLAGLRKRFRTS